MNTKNKNNIDTNFHPSSTIITEKELNLINGANHYKEKVTEQCDQLLKETQEKCNKLYQDTQAECENIKNQQTEELYTKLRELSDQLKQENYTLITKFCTTIEENIFVICYKILAQLHITTTTNQQLLKLIQEEISTYTQEKQLTIHANATNIAYLQEHLKLRDKKITYIEKESLVDGQCMLSDGFTTIHSDLEQCGKNILQLLNDTINNNE